MSKQNTHVNIKVQPKKDEPFERTLKRFMKKVKKERIIEQVKERRYYEKPSIVKRKQKLEGIKREKKPAEKAGFLIHLTCVDPGFAGRYVSPAGL